MKKMLYFMAAAMVLLLFLSACAQEKTTNETNTAEAAEAERVALNDTLLREISDNALPAEETETEVSEPGTLPAVKYLKRAKQDLVGKTVSLSPADLTKGDIIYRFLASEKQLVLLYYADNMLPVLLSVQTEIPDMKTFLAKKGTWEGKVTNVSICSLTEYMHTDTAMTEKQGNVAADTSVVCYGRRTKNGETVVLDGTEPLAQFEQTMERFGIRVHEKKAT